VADIFGPKMVELLREERQLLLNKLHDNEQGARAVVREEVGSRH
jgi:hypothetical protein